MKKQLIKLALLGLLSSFGYADYDFDIDKDGKIDKISIDEAYYMSYDNKKIYRPNLFIPNQDGSTVIPKYRNKNFYYDVLFKININNKKSSFTIRQKHKISIDGKIPNKGIIFIDKLQNDKGIIVGISDGVQGLFNIYLKYENNKWYVSKYSANSSNGGCIYTLPKKIPLQKILDYNKFEEAYLKNQNMNCINKQEHGNKGYNLQLEKEIYYP
jgi:hypothetical protein